MVLTPHWRRDQPPAERAQRERPHEGEFGRGGPQPQGGRNTMHLRGAGGLQFDSTDEWRPGFWNQATRLSPGSSASSLSQPGDLT